MDEQHCTLAHLEKLLTDKKIMAYFHINYSHLFDFIKKKKYSIYLKNAFIQNAPNMHTSVNYENNYIYSI